MDSSLILIIVLILLLFFSGFSSGSETGMMASNKVKLRNLSKKSKGAKRALNLLQRPDILLSAILVGNNFANILASSIVTLLVIDYFGGNVLLGSVILTIVILIFSEITPKTIASVYPEKFAEKSSWVLKKLIFIFNPIISFTNLISSKILASLNINPKDSAENDNLNTEELRTLLQDHGDLIPTQSRMMLSSILDLEDLTVEDIMVANSEIVGIDVTSDIEEAKLIISSSFYSRLPVYEGSIDKIIGILHLKDAHHFIENFKNTQEHLSEPYYVSQSTKLSRQLKEFQILDKNIGLVVDEYGEIEGLISIEDIFQEIVGKFDVNNNSMEIQTINKSTVQVDANIKVRDLNKKLNWELPESGAKTLNGLIIDYLEDIPQNKLCIQIDNYSMEIIELEDNSISKLKISKNK